MATDLAAAGWLKRFDRASSPIYLGLVEALEGAIRAGELQAGDQLPPQRQVAQMLGVDFTTVTRAYGAARDRGLLEGAVGRGTFVRARAAEDDAGLVDLSMNLPPSPEGVSLAAVLRDTTAAVLQRTDVATLMAYHASAGGPGQRLAATAWLAPVLGGVAPERVLVSAGAQTALAAIFSTLCRPGDTVAVEPLTYPGMKTLAAQLGLRLVPCEVDAEGVVPQALERLCRAEKPAALYLSPATQNPTTATMGAARRADVARLVVAHNLWLVEDDPYSRLAAEPLAAVATLAPERTFHVATLSKCLSPGLRLAFVTCPEGAMTEKIAQALRAMSLMPAPLMTAVAAAWIREGTAEALLAGVRREAQARRAIAATALPEAVGPAHGIHVWLPLPAHWSPGRLHQALQARGVSLVAADAFAVGQNHPNGARVSLGGPTRRATLADALGLIAATVRGGPDLAPKLVV